MISLPCYQIELEMLEGLTVQRLQFINLLAFSKVQQQKDSLQAPSRLSVLYLSYIENVSGSGELTLTDSCLSFWMPDLSLGFPLARLPARSLAPVAIG